MRRTLLMASGAALALVLAAGLGGYLYFFSGLHSAPRHLALSTSTPTPGLTTAPPSTDGSLAASSAGTWQVQPGSVAGYRATERFVGMTSDHQAVSRTSDVTGHLSLSDQGGRVSVDQVTVTVDLRSLRSSDTVAGYDVANRDRTVARDLDVDQFPNATFAGDPPVLLPAGLQAGQVVSVSVPGQLTIHGQTQQVTAAVQAKAAGAQIEVAGSISADMRSFGVPPPQAPFVTVQPAITLEFQLSFAKS